MVFLHQKNRQFAGLDTQKMASKGIMTRFLGYGKWAVFAFFGSEGRKMSQPKQKNSVLPVIRPERVRCWAR